MSSVPKAVLSEAAIAVPIGNPSAIAEPRSGLRARAWILTAVLFLVPLVAYWPATFHDYGLRDDYSNLRESHEEVGKVVKFCASHARPIYGWLLQATYGETGTVQNLQWMRFTAALLLGAISLVCFRGLRAVGWSFNTSLCFAVLLVLAPSAQVIAGWAVGWPYAAAALLAVGGFFTVGGGAGSRGLSAGVGRAVGQWAVALGLMLVSALIYQPSALFYLVPLAGALIVQRQRTLALIRALVGNPSRICRRHAGTGLCCHVRALCRACLRQVRPNCVRIALGRENRLVLVRAPAQCTQLIRAE